MRNFTSLSVIITVSFLLFSIESFSKESTVKYEVKGLENVLESKKYFSKIAVDAESINQFYKKYPN